MLKIELEVNAPLGAAEAVKEDLAMYLERYGDTRIVSVQEIKPVQMGFAQYSNHPRKQYGNTYQRGGNRRG